MAWRLARSLETLRSQVNAAYPRRSKLSDGTIGDAAHAKVPSDHNPNAAGVVCALDLTHDPTNGFDAHKLADLLITNRHPNLKYVISNRRIAGAWTNWKWQAYSGSNPHTKHIHVSVGNNSDGKSTGNYDSTAKWTIKSTNPAPPAQGGTMTFTNEAMVKPYYYILRGTEGTLAERKSWVGQTDARFLQVARAEAATRKKAIDSIPSLQKQIADLKKGSGGSSATPDQVLGGQIVSLIKKVK